MTRFCLGFVDDAYGFYSHAPSQELSSCTSVSQL